MGVLLYAYHDPTFIVVIIIGVVIWNIIKAEITSNRNSEDEDYSDYRDIKRNPFDRVFSSDVQYTKSRAGVYKENVLKLLAVTMNANGKQMVCELDRVKSTIKKLYKTEEQQKTALSKFRRYLRDYNVNIAKLCKEIQTTNNRRTLELLMMELLSVAYADGVFEDSERRVIKQIYRCFGITDVEFIMIENMFLLKKEQGKFGDTYVNKENSQEQKRTNTGGSSSYGNGSYNRGNSSNYGNNSGYGNGYRNQSNSNSNQNTNTADTNLQRAYKALGLTENSTVEEIKSARKKLLMKWHPDLFEAQGEAAVKRATENCKSINKAYEIICMARGIN